MLAQAAFSSIALCCSAVLHRTVLRCVEKGPGATRCSEVLPALLWLMLRASVLPKINALFVMQILTHVKEKLQFAQKEKEGMQAELDSVEAALATHRDDLGRVKLARDKALVATRKLRDTVSHVSNASLLADLEVKPFSSLNHCFTCIHQQ